eukprot:CAMPEP_0118724262 /NCGR_PEP_ID=MMETSP0800-20121206/32465_1 /TAXON_ID=210618 ORGANISM="Striatella unipunctata, Strain CCMP2910" /NCGR_SAMPLE_ID=MMETSP0800 /ASSEMBLY_ACC=CAM_ASM_000638 /LENGTH=280 /DNA_ID=CAMNT_0006632787 /DNA_START=243 /DNA_END=1085 /DNA_ORIENTATION=-
MISISDALSAETAKLEDLFIMGNLLDLDGLEALCEMLRCNKSIRRLTFKNHRCDFLGGYVFGDMLEVNTTLSKLILHNTELRDQGTCALVEGLRGNKTLRYLDLYRNDICDEGAMGIANLLRFNTAIEVLMLNSNHIRSLGSKAMARALLGNPGSVMSDIRLNRNQMGNVGLKAWAQLVRSNPIHLKRLELGGVAPGKIGCRAIVEALKFNHSLHHLDIFCVKLYLNRHVVEDAFEKAWGLNLTVTSSSFIAFSANIAGGLRKREAMRKKMLDFESMYDS